MRAKVGEKIEELIEMQDKCARIPDAQCAMLILQGSMDVCRVTHLLRSTPPTLISEAISKFDHNLRDVIGRVLAHDLTALEFDRFTLRIRDSGHGVGTCTHTSMPAYLSSYAAARPFIDRISTVSDIPIDCGWGDSLHEQIQINFVDRYNVPDDVVAEWGFKSIDDEYPDQLTLTEYVHEYRRKEVESRLTTCDEQMAYKLGCAPKAGAWKRAFPLSKWSSLWTAHYQSACARAYAWDQSSGTDRCTECYKIMDPKCYHALNCGKNGEWTHRHDAVKKCIHRWARKGNMDVVMEKEGLMVDGGMPGDLYFRSYHLGYDHAFDVTVKSPFRSEWFPQVCRESLWAAKQGEKEKRDKYEKGRIGDWRFVPLAIEATGGMAKPVRHLVRRVAVNVMNQWKARRYQPIQDMILREISCIVMREGADMVHRKQWRASSWSAFRK